MASAAVFFISLNEYYQAVKMLFMVYSLVISEFENIILKGRKEIAQVLAEVGVKR